MAPSRRRRHRPATPRTPYVQVTPTGVGIRAHGNWCGPNWSGGRFQASVIDNTPAVDTLDECCRIHDSAYATPGADLRTADLDFATCAFNTGGGRGNLFGALVGAQAYMRASTSETVERPRKRRKLTHVWDKMVDPDVVFPIMTTKGRKYAGRKRRGVRKYPKRKRTTLKRKKKYNKKRRGYRSGRYGKRRVSNFNKRNYACIKYETGSTINDANATYIGHGTPIVQITQVLFMSMIKQLFASNGISFVDWDEKAIDRWADVTFGRSLVLKWNYGTDEYIAWKETAADVTTNMTWYNMADQLKTNFIIDYKAAIAAAVPNQQTPVFHRLVLLEGTFAAPKMQVAQLELRNCVATFTHKSSLRCQNRTAAGAALGTTDINNVNPLIGRVYYSKPNKNYFMLKYKNELADNAGYTGWDAGNTTGTIYDKASYHTESQFKKLPTKSVVGAAYTKDFAIHPGQVIVDEFSYKKSFQLNTFMEKVGSSFSTAAATFNSYEIGKARVLGFEKLLADRTESNAVTLGYEIDFTVSCCLRTYNVSTQPYVNVV